MDFLEVMNEYFRGEKMLGYGIVAVGVGLLAFALFVWRTQEGGFMWGLVAPLAIVGIMAATVGPFFIVQQGKTAAEIAERYEADAGTLAREEGERMATVNASWPRLKLAWAVIGVIGMALILLVKQEWASGLGVALMILVAILFNIDVFAERRAEPYTRALEAIAPEDVDSD